MGILAFTATGKSPAETSGSEVPFYNMTCFPHLHNRSSNALQLPSTKREELQRKWKAGGFSRDLATPWDKFWPLVHQVWSVRSKKVRVRS